MAVKYFAPEVRGAQDLEVIGATEAAQRFGRKWRERVDELNAKSGYSR